MEKTTETWSVAGRVCLVTGANAGIGFRTAVRLAALGAHVICGCALLKFYPCMNNMFFSHEWAMTTNRMPLKGTRRRGGQADQVPIGKRKGGAGVDGPVELGIYPRVCRRIRAFW